MFRLIKKDYFYVFCLFFCGLALYAYGLNLSGQLFWDEITHINGARTILYGNKPYAELTQTPLGREMLLISIALFGDNPWGARVLTLISASLNLSLVYLIGRKLFKNQWLAVLSACFLLTDMLYYVQARIGMADQFLCTFLLFSFYCFLKIQAEKSSLQSYVWLGFWLSMAIAVKSVAIVFLPLYAFPVFKEFLQKKQSFSQLLKVMGCLILPLPLILWLSYALLGFSISEMLDHLVWLWGFLRSFHIHPSITSNVFDWLHLEKPIWYLYNEVDFNHSKFVLLTGNPFFWFAAEFSFVALLFFAKRIPPHFFYLHAAVVGQFLFWMIKPSTHLYYMLPVLPFYALLIGAFFDFLMQSFPEKRKLLAINAAILWFLSLGCFVYYYPILQGELRPNRILERYPNLPP